MKKTLNVNIGSMAFAIDEDAYYTLSGYYDDIRSRLYDSDKQEIMDDIESRTADIFKDNLAFPSQVVSIDLVKRAIAIIGSAQTFGERKYDPDYRENNHNGDRKTRNKLFRSRYDKVIGGVCGGLAEYLDADPAIVRLITFFLILFTGIPLLAYVVMWLVIPLEPENRTYAGRSGKDKKRRDRQ